MRQDQFRAQIAGLETEGQSIIDRLETNGGLTRTQIAKQARLSRDTIWRWGNGMAHQPALTTYLKLKALEQRMGTDRPIGQKTR